MTPTPAAKPLPYEKDAPNAPEWTDEAYRRLVRGELVAAVTSKHGIRTARVDGSCPRCDHGVNFERILDAVTGEDLGVLDSRSLTFDQNTFVEFVASCCCSEPHDERPEDVEHGCGINFRVDVLPSPPT